MAEKTYTPHRIITLAAPTDSAANDLLDAASQLPEMTILGSDTNTVESLDVWPRAGYVRVNEMLAEVLVDSDNRVHLTVVINQEVYLKGYAISANRKAGRTHLDVVHNAALAFGKPLDASVSIVGASHQDFIVEYSTVL